MATLYLHIGHGKTGSSYIQSSLALSEQILNAKGIIYPRHHSHERALIGAISSGNGGLLFDPAWQAPRDHIGKDCLFSDENLFQRMITPDYARKLELRAKELAVDRIAILLFIRDPVDHAQSAYQQSIKRGGRTWSIEQFFDQYRMPRLVKRFLEDNAKQDRAVSVRNYSRCRGSLLEQVENWLELDGLATPPTQVVNRSLTHAELAFQRELNVSLEKSAHFVADALCEQLPNIKADTILPGTASQQAMLKRLSDALEYVNARVSAEDQYSTTCTTPQDCGELSLKQAQISVIATALGQKIQALKSRVA